MIRFLSVAALLLAAPAAAQETRASANAKLDAEFKQSDANRDGFLSRAEIEARLRRMKVAGGRTLDPAQARRISALFLARGDTNKDGRVSRTESRALMGAVFARYDSNGDGRVEGAEAQRARAAARAKAGAKATR